MRQLLEKLNIYSQRFTFNQKILMGAIVGTLIISVTIFSFWLQSEEMAVLFTNLSPEDASTALDELAKLNVKTELANGGSTIKVPEPMVYRMRVELSAKGVPSTGTVGWGIFDGKQYGMTEFIQNVNFKRALEGELTRTIEAIKGIQAARVHLVLPKPSIFKKMQSPATASVVATLGRGMYLDERQIVGIQSLVAGSVEGLEANQVSVLDQQGVVLSSNHSQDGVGRSETQLAMKKEVDTYLAEKAGSMLDRVLGHGRAMVQVDATLNFDRLEQQRELYDPSTTVVRSEERNESSGSADGGVTEQSTANYEINRTLETVVNEIGGVSALSVAVFVDGRYESTEDGESVYTPLTEDELQQIQRIVESAVGVDAVRGDRIEVVNMQFQDPEPLMDSQESSPTGQLMDSLPQLIGRVLLFLLAGFMILRLKSNLGDLVKSDISPVSGRAYANAPAGMDNMDNSSFSRLMELDQEAAATEMMVEEVRTYVGDNPDEVADLVQAWMSDSEALGV
jgi:flagellar M-ring protein FliF